MGHKVYLLTGASGFLAQALIGGLTNNDSTIIRLGRSGQEINVDITKPFTLEISKPIDIVIHAAGKAHSVPRNLAEEALFYKTNFEGTKNLCAALERLSTKPKAIIFISTVAVYGLNKGLHIQESHPLDGSTPYAKSKIMAERWLSYWARENNVTLGILRLPLVAGPKPPGNLGSMVEGIRSGRYLSIGKGDSQKSMIWAKDITTILPALAKIGGTYNLTDGYHPTFRQLETAIAKALQKRPPFTIPLVGAEMLGRVGDIVGPLFPVNSEKIRKITATLTFDDKLARTKLKWNPSKVLDHIVEVVGA